MDPKKIVLFASGSGTNAENLIRYFNRPGTGAEVVLLLSNKENAGAVSRARNLDVPVEIFDRHTFYETDALPRKLQSIGTDLIVLAGFLWLVPRNLIHVFPRRIINIHPALLPKYGGKGMYGRHVHEAVLASGDKQSGITIHFVDEIYDHGEIIAQHRCPVKEGDTPESLAARIHELEYKYFPKAVAQVLAKI